ncbi:MAG: type IV pilin N-terminal domain-containing protein [Candidatus Hadarchaeales archaeon]
MKRCLRKEERGISPVIATILLIASTVAAASVIAVYVSGLYVGTTRVVAGDIDASVLDCDNGPGESYVNENVTITFKTTQGYLRNVGDPDRGLTVTFRSQRRGWGPIVADVKGQTNYAQGWVKKDGVFTVATGQYIVWRLYIPITSAGRLEQGTRGYLYVASSNGVNDTVDNARKLSATTKILWDDEDDWEIQVSCYGDSFSTSFGTVRLMGSNWIA